MQRTVPESRGPVRYGPLAPGPGLPVLPELAAVLAGAAPRIAPEPPGGGAALREAAAGYWTRRGLGCGPADIAAAGGAPSLLLALLAADHGDLLVPRPCPAWWIPQARLLGRSAYPVPTPAECGGVPDPYALLETVRRVRDEGGDPRLLLLSVADDPTGTVAPPEVVHEACEAAVSAGLHIISDETWNDTRHRPRRTVLLSPAEMCPEAVTVLVDPAGSLIPTAWPVAVARFPDTADGATRRARTLDVITAIGTVVAGPVAAAAAHALSEPDAVRERAGQAAQLYGRVCGAAHRAVLAAGALARPPQAVGTSTPTSGRCARGWSPGASPTPWNWRTTWTGGSGPRRRAAIVSGTIRPRCGCVSRRARSSGQPRRNVWSPSPRRSHSNSRMWPVR